MISTASAARSADILAAQYCTLLAGTVALKRNVEKAEGDLRVAHDLTEKFSGMLSDMAAKTVVRDRIIGQAKINGREPDVAKVDSEIAASGAELRKLRTGAETANAIVRGLKQRVEAAKDALAKHVGAVEQRKDEWRKLQRAQIHLHLEGLGPLLADSSGKTRSWAASNSAADSTPTFGGSHVGN